MTEAGWIILVQLAVTKAVPLLLAGLGGLLSERSGVINICLEGMMLAGAFGSISGAMATGSPWLGLLMGGVSGAALGIVHALSVVRYRTDAIISGTAVNLLAIGGTEVLLVSWFGSHGSTVSVTKLPLLGVGSVAFHPTTYLAFLTVLVISILIHRTTWGLRLRAAGEQPQTLVSVGVSVQAIRYGAVIASGFLAGVAGSHLALADLSQFVERMSAGRGFIALAALILGKWSPRGVLLACLFFGSAEALADGFQGTSSRIPPQLFLAMPFVLTMVVLAGFVGKSRPPAALGSRLNEET